MSDVSEFLQSYNEALQREIASADMPPELKEAFVFESLVNQDNGREVYFLTRKSDGLHAVLRITIIENIGYAAAESVASFERSNIPQILGTWEHHGRTFMVQEYFASDDLPERY